MTSGQRPGRRSLAGEEDGDEMMEDHYDRDSEDDGDDDSDEEENAVMQDTDAHIEQLLAGENDAVDDDDDDEEGLLVPENDRKLPTTRLIITKVLFQLFPFFSLPSFLSL